MSCQEFTGTKAYLITAQATASIKLLDILQTRLVKQQQIL